MDYMDLLDHLVLHNMVKFDLFNHLVRQQAFSHATFGPGSKTKGVIDHIRKELKEVEQSYEEEDHEGTMEEWVDVVILALDGLTRHISFGREDNETRYDPHTVASVAIKMIVDKQTKNEGRKWPDWRTAPKDKAIEHSKD